jgi:serine protease
LKTHRFWQVCAVSGLLASVGLATVSAVRSLSDPPSRVDTAKATPTVLPRLMVRFAAEASSGLLATRAEADTALQATGRRLGARFVYGHPTAGLSHVVALQTPIPSGDVDAFLAALRADPAVASVELDAVARPALIPNDELFNDSRDILWNLKGTSGPRQGGINLPTAWNRTRGAGVTVAVLDTGITPHADLDANVLANGYDFVGPDPGDGGFLVANDGDGRDADPTDPGDWISAADAALPVFAGCAEAPSSWHGTAMAGVIAAVGDNSIGMPGVAYEAKILPVRVLGKCKGYVSDIADAIRWAAGASPDGGVTWPALGIPVNTTPARVINLSLSGLGTCTASLQSAIDSARAAGAVVVASTGNDGFAPAIGARSIGAPASCAGVIAVTAHTLEADRMTIANWGAGTDISAPGGGDCSQLLGCLPHGTTDTAGTIWRQLWSTTNIGTTAPVASASLIFGSAGTSVSAAHVSGVAALLVSAMPTLRPDGVETILKESARTFPDDTFCWTFEIGTLDCGAGLLDASAAMTRLTALTPSAAAQASGAIVAGGSTVTLTGTATPGSGGSAAALTYAWQQLSGPAVLLNGATATTASFTAPSPGGPLSFRFTATDTSGASAGATVNLRSNTAPTVDAVPDQTVRAGQPIRFTVTGSDAEGDPLTFTATGLPTGASLTAAGAFDWAAAVAGVYTVSVTASDGTLSSAPRAITLTVGTNNPPEVGPIPNQSARLGETVTFTASATDAEGDAISFAATGLPSGATFTPAGAFSWPNASPAGTYTVSITASDGFLTSAPRAVNISVAANTAPTLSAVPNQTVRAGQALSFSVSATDAENDPVSFTATGVPAGATPSIAEGVWSFFWASPVAGNYTVALTASDGLLTSTRSIAITVSPNTPPAIGAIPAQTVRAGGSLAFTASATDAENDPVTFAATGLPTGATFSAAGAFAWSNATPVGTFNVSITATDGLLTSAARVVPITVRANTAPSVEQVRNFTVRLQETVNLTLRGSDPENDPLTFSATGLPGGASLTPAGVLSWPSASPGGDYTIAVTASDGLLGSAPMTFTISVTNRTTDPGGGGGAMDLLALALLGSWSVARLRRRTKRGRGAADAA